MKYALAVDSSLVFDDKSEGISYVEHREKWIAGGFHWFRDNDEPAHYTATTKSKLLSSMRTAAVAVLECRYKNTSLL